MAITISELESCIKESGINQLFADPANNVIMVPIGTEMGNHNVMCHLDENGEYLRIFIPNFFNYSGKDDKLTDMLTVLMHMNYQRKGVKFGYDPDDGDFSVACEAFIEDGTVTTQQFGRWLSLLLISTDEALDRLQNLRITGKDPGEGGVLRWLKKKLGGSDEDSEKTL